mgnify:CR=1 FL=1
MRGEMNMTGINGLNRDIEWIKETLGRIEKRFDDMDARCVCRHHEIDREIAALKVRAGLYGALAGAAPAVVGVLMLLLRHV